jgi:soluble lytic murein transglycosylase-like protein
MLSSRSLALLGFVTLAVVVGAARQLTPGADAASAPPASVGLGPAPVAATGRSVVEIRTVVALPATRADLPRDGAAAVAARTETVWEMADRYSARYGLDDRRVLRALILAESEGNPRAVKRTEREWSVGLLQANRLGGRGAGYSEAELQDPERNLALGMPEITAAYRQAHAAGYRGAPLAVRVAELAQRPDPDPLHRFAAAYESLQ